MSAKPTNFVSPEDYDAGNELRRKTPKKRTSERDALPEDATQISSFLFQDENTKENVEIKINQVI